MTRAVGLGVPKVVRSHQPIGELLTPTKKTFFLRIGRKMENKNRLSLLYKMCKLAGELRACLLVFGVMRKKSF
jgi:hypothetical protein